MAVVEGYWSSIGLSCRGSVWHLPSIEEDCGLIAGEKGNGLCVSTLKHLFESIFGVVITIALN